MQRVGKARVCPIKRAFQAQKDNACGRKIRFDFTYDEWCAWWMENLGPNWAALRGCRADQYVMARKDDRGPYSRANVKCITAADNVKEAMLVRKHGNTDGPCAALAFFL